MEAIVSFFDSIGIDYLSFCKAALIVLIGALVLVLLGRFVCSKHSVLNTAISSSIGILFIYAVSVVLRSAGIPYEELIAPLPFVSISGVKLSLFSFSGAHYTVLCSEILSMIILSFLVNIADGWLPRGKGLFAWTFFRCLTVVIGYLMHLVVLGLFSTYLPEGIVTYAPTILLALLVLMLLTGALKLLVGILLATVNPIIGGLYTFFFATVIGKQITKAVLTTAILSIIVVALRYAGITAISITSSALIAYIPIMLILIALWYLVCHDHKK